MSAIPSLLAHADTLSLPALIEGMDKFVARARRNAAILIGIGATDAAEAETREAETVSDFILRLQMSNRGPAPAGLHPADFTERAAA